MIGQSFRKATTMAKHCHLKTLGVSLSLTVLVNSLPVMAQAQTDTGPTCQAKTLTIEPIPADLELGAFSVDPLKDGPACVDPAGGKLTLVSVGVPGSLDPVYGIHISTPPSPGQTITVTFTVQDSTGKQMSSALTIIRH
jgi:hypothetical protein